jgi:ankyrin repeat protein
MFWPCIIAAAAALLCLISLNQTGRARAGMSPDCDFDVLLHAIVEGDVGDVREALSRHIDLNLRTNYSLTALHIAVMRQDHNAVRKAQALIDCGAVVDAVDDFGTTPLIAASMCENVEAVELLLRNGANPDARNNMGNTPLHQAACSEEQRIVSVLLAAGANRATRNSEGVTPLQLAREQEHFVAAKFLEEATIEMVGTR